MKKLIIHEKFGHANHSFLHVTDAEGERVLGLYEEARKERFSNAPNAIRAVGVDGNIVSFAAEDASSVHLDALENSVQHMSAAIIRAAEEEKSSE